MRLSLKARIILLMAVAMTTAWAAPSRAVLADGEIYQRDELESSSRLASVTIANRSYIDLKSATVMPGDNGNMLYFTLTVTNGTGGTLSFLDYWVKVYNKSGAEFKPELIPQDKLKKEIPAGQQVDYTFYAPVNDATVLQDLWFQITRWDYTSAELEKPIGNIQFPQEAADVWAPETNLKTVQMGGVPVQLEITRWTAQANDNYISPKLTLKMTNKGYASIKLPGYQYALRAANGAMYPLEIAVNGDKQTLQPEVPVELQLKAVKLPATAGADGWDLVLTQTLTISNELKLNAPVTALKVIAEQQDAALVGATVDYANENGVYELKVDKLDRMPWEDQDVLSTNLSISHKEADALPFPNIQAYYELDGGVRVDAKLIKTDQSVGVPSGTDVHFQLIGKIPYTYSFASTKLFLVEKVSENATEEMAQFTLPPFEINMPVIPYGKTQSISGIGRNTQFAPRWINMFTDGKSNLLEVQLETSNLEKRSSTIPKLTAYFKTADQSLYPTKIREVKQKLNPQGKALISFTGKLPKGVDTEGLRLVIGESITDQHLSVGDEKADAYINAVEMELPREIDGPNPTVKQVNFYPYTISLSNISTWLDSKELRVNFLYNLEKDSNYETNNEGSKLVIQFQDISGNMTYEQKFFLETASDKDDLRLELGEHSYKMTVKDTDLLGKIQSLKQYRINIYHEFQGMRKQLATQTMDWFGVTE
ncbi:hypothetical protein ACFQ88_01770 [Paenibacillus sp. NPDC056579]|uniref:hypothetical protein n=1 Tax=Paenibacillus sp. NPDC056579 TaxID=3345871 RepID=UPI0036C58359